MNIVQIGACDGNDELTEYLKGIELSKIDKLILVEPMKVHHSKLRTLYKDYPLYIEECVIGLSNSSTKFYYHKKDGPRFCVSSLSKEHIYKHGYTSEDLIEIDVPCMDINNLFDKYELKVIDYLNIDAEGYDDIIIQTINFDNYIVKAILFEELHINAPRIVEYLSAFDYECVTGVNRNCLATKK